MLDDDLVVLPGEEADPISDLAQRWGAVLDPESSLPSSVVEGDVDIIEGRGEIERTLMKLAENCETQLTSITPGRAIGRLFATTRLANEAALGNGAKTRSVFQYGAARDETSSRFLREMVTPDSELRVTAMIPGRGWAIDGRIALLLVPSTHTPGEHSMAVVRETAIVQWLIAGFEHLWMMSTPLDEVITFSDDAGTPDAAAVPLDPTRVRILRLMAEGEKDEVIARRLNISVRTCRRHIADYLDHVGATSRFQAGVIAARSGHLLLFDDL